MSATVSIFISGPSCVVSGCARWSGHMGIRFVMNGGI